MRAFSSGANRRRIATLGVEASIRSSQQRTGYGAGLGMIAECERFRHRVVEAVNEAGPNLEAHEAWNRFALRRDKTRRRWIGFAHMAAAMVNLRLAEFSHTAWHRVFMRLKMTAGAASKNIGSAR